MCEQERDVIFCVLSFDLAFLEVSVYTVVVELKIEFLGKLNTKRGRTSPLRICLMN